ncbi:hypothetical protein C7964_1157 [Loktanella sp. PT4BL]|jgi:hypothetical protein|nr:hypothetical protein C7964_1157 [Loktanella sp. PT4BL]
MTNEAKPFNTVWLVNEVCSGAELFTAEPFQKCAFWKGLHSFQLCSPFQISSRLLLANFS